MRLLFSSIVLALAVGVLSSLVSSPPTPAEIVVMLILPAVIAWGVARTGRSLWWAIMMMAVTILPAHAQAVAGGGLFDSIRPALADIAVAVIATAIAWAAQRFQALTGIQIEAKHREALQSALANGARMMIENGSEADFMRAIDYVERSVPDALVHFRAKSRDRIRELLRPHVATATVIGAVPISATGRG
jgi:hypothetical protein